MNPSPRHRKWNSKCHSRPPRGSPPNWTPCTARSCCGLPASIKNRMASVIAEWTGVPLNRLSQNEMSGHHRPAAVAGRHHQKARRWRLSTCISTCSRPRRSAPSGTSARRVPVAGPSGVGKTETDAYSWPNCSTAVASTDHHQPCRVSGETPFHAWVVPRLRLYVGYGEGGVLTEAIRRETVLRGAARRGGESPRCLTCSTGRST